MPVHRAVLSGASCLALLLVAVPACSVSSNVDRSIGARCDDRSECDDRCLPPADYPGGFCTLSCERVADCPSDASCIDREGGVCLFACQMDPDCAFLGSGWTCSDEPVRGQSGAEVSVCVPS